MSFIPHQVVTGWSSLVALQCIFSGSVLVTLGLAGDCIARIYEEVKGRPLCVVQDALSIRAAPAVGRVVFETSESTRKAE